MNERHFYYIDDRYFSDFPDLYLMQNKELVDGRLHDRPCFYAFRDDDSGLFWMVPFSSQVHKYEGVYTKKMEKYRKCDTIVFGDVLGHKKAFLIQNMCPVTADYIKNEYVDSRTNRPVRVDGALEKELIEKAKKVLSQLLHFQVLLISPAENTPKAAALTALLVAGISEGFVDLQMGQAGMWLG